MWQHKIQIILAAYIIRHRCRCSHLSIKSEFRKLIYIIVVIQTVFGVIFLAIIDIGQLKLLQILIMISSYTLLASVNPALIQYFLGLLYPIPT